MKNVILGILVALALMQVALALNLDIQKQSTDEVMIAEFNKPVSFDVRVHNLGDRAQVELYNLLGFSMTPVGKIDFAADETKDLTITLAPIGDFNHIGPYTLTYYFRDDTGAEITKTFTFRRVHLSDAFAISADAFDPDANKIDITITNLVNVDFGKATVTLHSSFFDVVKEIEFTPKETQHILIELNKEDFNELLAGFYTMDSTISVNGAETSTTTTLEFVEKNNLKTETNHYGFLLVTDVITKQNDGNIVTNAKVSVTKNIVSRLFTSFSPEPDAVERDGAHINYFWEKELSPGEALAVSVKTNWIFPLIIVLIIVSVVLVAKRYATTPLSVKKKVSFVRAKGGEFALKVSLYLHARKYIENITLMERLPPLVRLYERFGVHQPKHINEKARRIDWQFEKLEAGETRVVSYILYSKVGVMGKFSLPSAKALYEKDGEAHEVNSNRAFLVAEPRGKDIEEE